MRILNPVILGAETRWECPNCTTKDVTREAEPHTRFHTCRANGLTSPMVRAGTKAKVTPIEREDYLNNEEPQYDANGRPIMAIVTTREDGQDCTVLAPVAGVVTEM